MATTSVYEQSHELDFTSKTASKGINANRLNEVRLQTQFKEYVEPIDQNRRNFKLKIPGFI